MKKASFCISCGSALEEKNIMNEIRPACPQCGWVYYEDPKVAVAVVVQQNGQVLLTRRINIPYQGMWSLPAGFVNAREDPAAAAERECLEETGLTVKVGEVFTVLTGREHSRGSDILLVYRATTVAGIPQAGDDADLVMFFSKEDLPPLAFQSTHKILDLIYREE